MPKPIATVLLLLFITVTTHAQTVANTIELYGENFPAEKIHIHFDKEVYLPGEIIWFKAYLFEENLPSQRSSNLYISIYDETGKALERKVYPVINASADGFFKLPDSLTATQLICRAYTRWMLNFDSSFLFTKAIPLINGKAGAGTQPRLTTNLQFFPEGGDIIEGERNAFAFKNSFSNGLPYNFTAVIKKQETGEVVNSIQSQHDGMGKFDIEQQPGEHYYAEWQDHNGLVQRTFLPQAKQQGISFKMIQYKGKLIYNVVNRLQTDTVHLLAYMYQKIVFNISLALPPGERYTGRFVTDSLPSGVMQLTVFDNTWNPVAERICFINNNNYTVAATMNQQQAGLQKRKKNIFEIAVTDTIPTNLSLSVTDADINNAGPGTNIITGMLLNGDIRGYIHNPAYYFENTDSATVKNLDLVMLTHGWRRYKWDDILLGKMPEIKAGTEEYLSIYGQINQDIIAKIKKDEMVNLIIKTKDSTTHYHFTSPDKNGLLKYSGLIFYDTAKIYYSFNTQKQYNKQLAFGNTNYTLQQPRQINDYPVYLIRDTAGTGNSIEKLYSYYNSKKSNLPFNKEKTLQTIVVKNGGWHNWKNDPLLKMDEKYTRGMFSGGANSFALDLVHDESARNKLDVYSYIRNKIPGLHIGNYDIQNGRSLSYLTKNVLIYIDEHEALNTDLDNLSINEVAYIKFFPSFLGRGPEPGSADGINPAIILYTKKGDDLIDRTPKETDLGVVKIPGYSPVKEFYSPDYSLDSNTVGTDARTTLLWLPYIFTGKGNVTIPVTFYNNDFSKRLKITLEGINDEGKLIHIEKIIE